MSRCEDSSRLRHLVAEATKPIVAVTSDPKIDAARERQRASFSSDNLCEYMQGGKDVITRRKELIDLLTTEPWGDKSRRNFLDRREEYVAGLRGAVGIWYVYTMVEIT